MTTEYVDEWDREWTIEELRNFKQMQNTSMKFTLRQIENFIKVAAEAKAKEEAEEAAKAKAAKGKAVKGKKTNAIAAESEEEEPKEAKRIEISKGTTTIVYRGELNGQPIAIKEVAKKEKYEKEKNNFEKLEVHPLLIKYIGHAAHEENDNNSYHIVTEFMPTCLNDVYREEGFTWLTLLNTLIQIGEILIHIHKNGYIYYDLKPPNILMDKDNNIKLCDLGSLGTKNDIGAVTTGYHPKDIRLGGEHITEKVDVYGFGISMLQLMMKEAPERIGETIQGKHANKVTNVDKENIIATANSQRLSKKHVMHKHYMNQKEDACSEVQAKKLTNLAFRCAEQKPEGRPSMNEALDYLKQEIQQSSSKEANREGKGKAESSGSANKGQAGEGSKGKGQSGSRKKR